MNLSHLFIVTLGGLAPSQAPLVAPDSSPPAPAPVVTPQAPAPPPVVEAPPVEPAPSRGVEPEDEDLQFGDHLFEDGDYYRSVTEYRRYLWRTKGKGEHAPRVAMAIGEAYLRGAQYEAAALQFDGVAERRSDTTGRSVAHLAGARAYLLDERPLLARPRARRVFNDTSLSPTLRSEAAFLLGLSYMEGENYAKARKVFLDPLLNDSHRAPLAKALLKSIQQRDSLPQKSPILAFVLSLVPGLGHFYLGQWAVGFTALMWNALFIFGAADAWIQRSWGVAIILTLLELTFYGGSIFGAVTGAFKYNRDQELNWRDAVRAQYEAALILADPPAGSAPGSLVRFGIPVNEPVP